MSADPTFAEALKVWARIGVLSFGGPAGQIALMHKELVDDHKWLAEQQFLNALNFCMLLPGPEAMQLATYSGWRLHGVKGGLTAGLLFILPGAAIVLALAFIYAVLGNVPAIEAVFLGVKAAVLVIVVEALLRIAKRALKRNADWAIAAASFVAIFFFAAPFPLIILAAALIGFTLGNHNAPGESQSHAPVPLTGTVATIVIWLGIWLVPLAAITIMLGPSHVLAQTGLFFSKLAIVTFGGAYAVLAYMAQQAVETHGWLSAGEMLDGLGLAETTPGPLILVTEFVGTLAAFRSGGSPAWAMGLAGAAVTLWATFAPCFLWIFAGAPYVERIGANARLSGALSGVTAAVVGVILNLALWFALHVLFAKVTPVSHGLLRLWTPDLATFDWLAGALSLLAAILLLWRHMGVITVLAICAGLGLVVKLAM
jgi:chromate transporter